MIIEYKLLQALAQDSLLLDGFGIIDFSDAMGEWRGRDAVESQTPAASLKFQEWEH